ANVGVSAWKIFLTTIEGAAKILDATLVPALRVLADLMEKNQTAVTLLVGAFAAFKPIPSLFTRMSTALAPVVSVVRGAVGRVSSFAESTRDLHTWTRQANPELTGMGTAMRTAGAMGREAFAGVAGALGRVRQGMSNVVAAMRG